MAANALSAATWSAMLAIGASVGGLVTAALDAMWRSSSTRHRSSARRSACEYPVRLDSRGDATRGSHVDRRAWERASAVAALTGVADLVDGLRYVRGQPYVAALLCVKAGWGLAGGVLLLLAVFGQRVFPIGQGRPPALACCTARAALAPALGQSRSDGFWAAAGAPAANHRPRILHGGGVLHGARRRSDAGTRGDVRAARALRRVHPVGIQHGPAAARSSRSLSRSCVRCGAGTCDPGTSLSSYFTANALDRHGWSPRALSFTLGALFLVPGILWLLFPARWQLHDQMPGHPAATPSAEESVLEGRIG
jgi:hypothetical protein